MKNKDYISPRLIYNDKSKYKSIHNKRNRFRKDAKNNYLIIDKRLYYKYKIKDKIKELKIPFLKEKKVILNNIHNNHNHASIKYPKTYH